MCKNCGDCTKEHDRTIDDSMDEVEDLGFYGPTSSRNGTPKRS